MAKTKAKPDSKLYSRLRDSGVRKKVAARAAEALPTKGSKKPSLAHGIANELTKAADSIKERAGGSRKRSKAAKKGALTRKRNTAKRRRSARKGAKTRSGS